MLYLIMAKIKYMGCSVEHCTNKHESRGYCSSHYKQFMRYGSVRVYTGECAIPWCAVKTTTAQFCVKHANLMKQHSLSDAQLIAVLAPNVCAICGKDGTINHRALSLDHDHTCCPSRRTCGKCVRGLVCDTCNLRLSALDDNSWLQKAQAYLANEKKDMQ